MERYAGLTRFKIANVGTHEGTIKIDPLRRILEKAILRESREQNLGLTPEDARKFSDAVKKGVLIHAKGLGFDVDIHTEEVPEEAVTRAFEDPPDFGSPLDFITVKAPRVTGAPAPPPYPGPPAGEHTNPYEDMFRRYPFLKDKLIKEVDELMERVIDVSKYAPSSAPTQPYIPITSSLVMRIASRLDRISKLASNYSIAAEKKR